MLNGTPTLIAGTLGRDPETQQVNGSAIVRLSVAVSSRIKRQGQWQDGATVWYRVTCWDKYVAQHAMASLHKGDRVLVYGLVSVEEYQGRPQFNMTSDAVGADLSYNDVTVIPRNRKPAQQGQAQAQSDPWGAQGNEFGGNDDDPEF